MSETEILPVKPKYSIITVNTNGLAHTMKCVESIFACTKDFELIIIDNASDDGSAEYLNHLVAEYENVKLITTPQKYTFSVNNNFGIKIATGEFIVFLNNDTIVSEDWLIKMENHFINIPLDKIGAVGPVTSNSNGKQAVGIQDPKSWHAKHHRQWTMTGVLFGWCMMFKKSVIDEIGGFDEDFENSHEDNELCLRAQLSGYKLIIALDTYIYHEGQATLRKMMKSKEEYLDKGLVNRELFYDKYYDHEKTKKYLVAVYRTNGGEHLEESLTQTSKFSDSIIIHFCRSKWSKHERDVIAASLKERFPKIVNIGWYDGVFQEDYERNWLLQEALKLQASGLADWCISIDDDEIYEDKFISKVQAFMNPRNPEVFAYTMNWRTIWKTEMGKEFYRADSTFGQFMNHRFFRLIPGQVIKSFIHPEGHHCGSAPMFAPENIQWTNIRVRHLGYDSPEQRQKKYEFYQANDHFKRREDIGNDDYSHLIDQNVNYQVYDKDNSISFVTMVKNEEVMIRGFLEHVQHLVDEYVIVDTGSTDKTLEIINDFKKYCPVPVRVISYPWENNYSTPRNFGKSLAKGKWILRMDADERFMMEDITRLFGMTERESEFIIFHVINHMEEPNSSGRPPKYASTESMRLYRNYKEVFYSGLVHETLDDCLSFIASKRKIKVERAQILLHHYGYLKDKSKIRGKLDNYEILNNAQAALTNNTDPRSFFNLALHYLNDDKPHDALAQFKKCIDIDPGFWMAYQQMAALNIKSAKSFLDNTIETIPSQHPFRKEAITILELLNKHSVGYVKVT